MILRRLRSGTSERAQTLVEVIIACAVMVVVLAAGLGLSIETRDAWSHVYADTEANESAREALHILATELSSSGSDRVEIVAGSDADRIEFQVPVALEGDEIAWGADGNQGYFVRVSVVDGALVRDVLNAEGVPVGRTYLLSRSIDSLHQERKGFAVTRHGALCTLTLRNRLQRNGQTWRKEIATGVVLRN